MNPATLIYVSAAERKLVERVIGQEELNTLEELRLFSEACCDLYNQTFAGEIGGA